MRYLLTLLFACISVTLFASPDLRFNADGKFRIVQFTDVHFKYGKDESAPALRRIAEIIEAERPDLVIFTGDIIYSEPAEEGLREVLSVVDSRNVPFAVTMGNHDHEQGRTNAELYAIARSFSHCVQPENEDYVIPVYSADGSRAAASVYCLDSHDYAQIEDVGNYAWITFDQVQWYRRKAAEIRDANGGKLLPAVAFFHIPLPEYNLAAASVAAPLIGTRRETPCSPAINTGLFAAMKEAGDVMAVFVGHDHDNDYAVLWHDILLAYGRYTGGNTVYNHLENGARIIELQQDKRNLTTWIRLSRGRVIDRTE